MGILVKLLLSCVHTSVSDVAVHPVNSSSSLNSLFEIGAALCLLGVGSDRHTASVVIAI